MHDTSTTDRFEFLYATDRRAVFSLLSIVLLAYCGAYMLLRAYGRPTESAQIHFDYLAEAFLNGHLDVDPSRAPGLTELVPHGDKWFVAHPLFPAVVVMPLVALFGVGFGTAKLAIVLMAVTTFLTYTWLRRLNRPRDVAWWAALLLALGTSIWYCAMRGSSWLFAHVVAVTFLTASLCEATGRKRGLLVGLLLGAAVLSRLPVVLATPFVAYLATENTHARWRTALMVFAGVGLFVAVNMAYNWARFDSLANVAYQLIPGVLQEPWYSRGILHPSYLISSAFVMLMQPPVLVDRFPYVAPSLFGMSVLLTTPAWLLTFLAPLRHRRTWVLIGAAAACLLPGMLHGWPGGDQFGYRFSLDAVPFIIALMALGMGARASGRARFLIVLSVLIGLWGLAFVQPLPVQWLYPVSERG